ncbi:hypothetical protein JQC91_02910 [Jannaschia sp. Os4]|uniref:hypothetical protein n=1 Tax=Jannaschia sp. Os4 TaxID=2807617 RepID=UPI00193AC055|nr:hypothetical protein [Jannaschia sp. Os4]MBM2575245.1 hypothetical protein [Jannaschia sp. Os4]
MSDLYFLPKEVREGLERARAQRTKRKGRLRVQVGETWLPIVALDATGFEVALADAPRLRGLVEIHDGARLVRTCLIVAMEPTAAGGMRYEFKRATAVRRTPALDYVADRPAPAGHLAAE